jgi:hypothetical protein
MSVTKLKTVGSWQPVLWESHDIGARSKARGRVITGLLTGGDASADPPVAQDQRKERTR